MKTNVGTIDRVFRIVLGVVLLSLLFFVQGNLRWVGLVGIVPLATALMGWCPLYSVFGISSCPMKAQ
jgi:Protein of unknown function (DUF2892)